MSRIWVVVADAGRARIFAAQAADGQLREIESLSNPVMHLPERELETDRAGRVAAGGGQHHGYGGPDRVRDTAETRFAAQLRDHLERALLASEFDRLYVIAAPAFLGHLRAHRSRALDQHTRVEVAADLSKADLADIRAHLPEQL